MSETPANGTAFRLAELERRVASIERLEPAVVKQQVHDVGKDIEQIASDVKSLYRLFVGFVISFAFIVLTALMSLWLSSRGAIG